MLPAETLSVSIRKGVTGHRGHFVGSLFTGRSYRNMFICHRNDTVGGELDYAEERASKI